jgi:creatinine amidohydrolase/Fe(II)-dependent formamide hydrolase-like protein
MMLAIAPQLVRHEQIAQLSNSSGGGAVRATILDQTVTWPWTTNDKQIADVGVIGDPKTASAEFGERMLDRIAEMAGSVFKQLLDRQHLARS